MATAAQITANRENAKKSTGPRTEEGKANSSQNAVKFGFYSEAMFIREDERPEFELMCSALHEQVKPSGPIAWEYVFQLIHAFWNLRRLREIEMRLLSKHDDPYADPNICKQLETIARHQTRFERSLDRALRQLRIERTNHFIAGALHESVVKVMPQVVDVRTLQKAMGDIEKTRDVCMTPAGPESEPKKKPPIRFDGLPYEEPPPRPSR